MKTRMNFLVMGMTAIMGCTFVACSDDETASNLNLTAIQPAKTPDVLVYSGNNVIGSTFASRQTRADVAVNDNYFKIIDWESQGKSEWMMTTYPTLYASFDNAPARTDRDEQVSTDEYNFVMDYIKNHPDEGGTQCNLTTYFIQNVGSSYDTYHLAFMNGDEVHHTVDITGGNYMDFVELDGTHISDYNATWGQRALVVNVPVNNPRYHDSFYNLTIENAYKFYYIEYNGKPSCYLCFDYRTEKYDNGLLDYDGDGVYNDWVIKLIPADGSDPVKPIDSIVPPTDPDEKLPYLAEVEVNLSVNEAKTEGDYIATKLSIHVRDTTDVEVFLPVPAEYYCDADDMNIVLSHRLEVEAHGPSATTMNYDVNGQTVTLTVTYEAAGIRVATQGVNAEVLKYLRQEYGDGITFEVWNYYKSVFDDAETAITRDMLKPLFDLSTVTFTSSQYPKWYVNAFNNLDGAENAWDCIVTPPAAYGVVKKYDGTDYNHFNVLYAK